MTIGELPFVTSIFPLGGRVGDPVKIAMKGWNLAGGRRDAAGQGRRTGSPSGRRPQAEDGSPTACPSPWTRCRKASRRSRTTTPANAQKVELPLIVNGRIDRPDDWDVFQFAGRAGETLVAEVSARRLDSPLDSVLKVTDAAGKLLAFNDDYEDLGSGVNTHHADSLPDGQAARGRHLLRAPGRHRAERRRGVRLPPADQCPAARFRPAGRALQRRPPRQVHRDGQRLRDPQGRLHRSHQARAQGSAQGILRTARHPVTDPGGGPADRQGRPGGHRGTGPADHRRPGDGRGQRDRPRGRAGGRPDAGVPVAASRAGRGPAGPGVRPDPTSRRPNAPRRRPRSSPNPSQAQARQSPRRNRRRKASSPNRKSRAA